MLSGQLLLGTLMIAGTVVFHVTVLVYLAGSLRRLALIVEHLHTVFGTTCLITTAVFIIILIHTIEAWGWAALFLYLGEFDELKQALYFSVVTSTTLGYGDITLSNKWQILGTFEAMGGLILFGTSTAFLLGLMRRLFEETSKNSEIKK